MAEIYALTDPRDGSVRYIGKANNSVARLKAHLMETRRKTPVYRWIGKLRSIGMSPGLVVIETCRDDAWEEAEIRIIAEHRAHGDRLLNVANGGDQPYCSTETRAENGKNNSKLRVSTPFKRRVYELKRDIGQALKRGYVSESGKDKIRYAAMKRPDLFGSLLVWL